MRRRWHLVNLALALVTTAAVAQQPGRIYRVAVVSTGMVNAIAAQTLPELARLGFVEGQNLSVTMRGGVPVEELVHVARETIGQRPDLVIAVSPVVVRAFADATKSIPILMSFTNDPIAEGFVTSFTRPGGNVTGQALLQNEQTIKRVELLHEAFPGARHIGVLLSSTDSTAQQLSVARSIGERIGLKVSDAQSNGSEDYEAAIARLKRAGAEAVVVASDPRLARDAAAIAQVALASRLPIICEWDFMARQGCLLSFGPDNDALRRRSGQLAAVILRGTPPAELPIEGPDRFELVINLQTARSIGVEFSPTFLARADEVIE